ncbi:MAG: fused MFS/spermidine synthase [Thermodesulfobacteriota bacterium]
MGKGLVLATRKNICYRLSMKYTKSPVKFAILLCFFITGVTGLVYEQVWTRMLILTFGSTQVAVTTVLTTFMTGLALGSILFGRIIDRYPYPLIVYGIVELLIGIYCFFTPQIFEGIRTVYLTTFESSDLQYASFSLTQFSFSFLGIIIPATLMGGTLPVMVKYFTEVKEKIGLDTGFLYSINTLGAVLGCFITGSFLLYFLGVKETLFAAGGVDIAIGSLVIFFYAYTKKNPDPQLKGKRRKKSISLRSTIHDLPDVSWTNRIVIIAFLLSGFAALAYEVLWFRIFSLVVGSSIYAFTIMLSTFLIGIALGSALFAPFIDKRRAPLLWFALLETGIGISVLISIFFYKELPFLFTKMALSFSDNFWIFMFFQALLCGAVMIIPTLCMGATFPTVSRIYTKSIDRLGTSIGNIYFFNTLGAIFGSFVGGFILIPLIGIQQSIILISILNISLGIILVAFSSIKSTAKIGFAGFTLIMLIALLSSLPPWEKMIMTMGTYTNPLSNAQIDAVRKGEYREKLIFYKEGINATITVRRGQDGKTITYQANGKDEARATGSRPAEAWSVLGHIPMLLSKRTEDTLLIGLGSGITLGAIEKYPVRHIDVVELEPEVVEVTKFFSESNNNALEDQRVDLHITDGRNFLFTTERKYNVIISAVSDPWITGVSNLFTQEYFREVENKLDEDGIVALWFQNYRISLEDLKTGLNTFASVFPNVSLWFHYAGTADLIVIGSKSDHRIDLETLKMGMTQEKVRKDLARIDINTPFDIMNLFLMGDSDLRDYVNGANINTDNKNILEFSLPKLLYSDPGKGNNERVMNIIEHAKDISPVFIPETVEGKEDFYYRLGVTYASFVFRTEQAIGFFRKVLKINPKHEGAIHYIEELNRLKKI